MKRYLALVVLSTFIVQSTMADAMPPTEEAMTKWKKAFEEYIAKAPIGQAAALTAYMRNAIRESMYNLDWSLDETYHYCPVKFEPIMKLAR